MKTTLGGLSRTVQRCFAPCTTVVASLVTGRIQMRGVDIHTIGCLLALGEVTRASTEFRSKLQEASTK